MDRGRRTVTLFGGAGIAALVVAGVFLLLAWRYVTARHPGWSGAGDDCRRRYAAARTARDTAAADARPAAAATCGALRRAGDLGP